MTELTDSSAPKAFEKLYIGLRGKEDRIYTDEQVASLPDIESSHSHFDEWQLRKRSAFRLLEFLKKKNRDLDILETGCGNGWLCGMLSGARGTTVTGIDINESELNQARRVFGSGTNIYFRFGDIGNLLADKKYDIIIFAASIQYFPSFDVTIRKTLDMLKPEGEIHILDSPFYSESEVVLAEKRSEVYYQSMGYAQMSGFYFHHTLAVLKHYNHKILFSPFRPINRLLHRKDLFPWICIRNS